jgi:PAS domain S-box-containing protein
MEVRCERTTEEEEEEIRRLQRCINDLVSVLALPALWSGGEPSHVLHTLLDAMQRMLLLDLVYVRLRGPTGETSLEMVRLDQSPGPTLRQQEICPLLNRWLGDDPPKRSARVRNPVGDGDISIIPLRLGLHSELGLIVVGSRRADFPRQTESLLLSVAANQASLGLQEARLRNEQKRLASELEERIAQRTVELAEANEELRREIAERKLVEERLRQEERELKRSEARKAAILDSVLDCIVTIDHQGCITEFNPAAESTFGYRRDEVLGRCMSDVMVPPSHRKKHVEGFARYLATGEARVLGRRVEMTASRADGSEFAVELAITRVALDGPPLFTGYLRDITERKRNEDALRDAHTHVALSEERWRSVFENSAIGVSLTDLNGRFLAANPVYEQMLGYTEEEMQKLSFFDITCEEDLESNRKLIGELLAGKRRQFQIEKQYRRMNGSLVWVRNNVSMVPGTERVPQFLMALSEDITERKQAEEKLRRSEALLAEVELLSLTGGFSWRVDTDELTFSEEAYRIFEFKKDAPVMLEQIGSRVHPEDIRLWYEKMALARVGGGDHDYEFRLRMPDGSAKYLHTIAHRTRDREGRFEYIGAIQDITQRRLSDEALGKARSELAHVSRVMSLGVLTASIAHEITQPLGAMVNNADGCLLWLAKDPPNLDQVRWAAERIIRDGRRARDVIQNIRALARKSPPEMGMLDINRLIGDTLDLMQSELQRHEVSLEARLTANGIIKGDQTQLQQVIVNLVTNAIEAMGGSTNSPRIIRVMTESDLDGCALVMVEDSGSGIDSTILGRIFDAMFTTKTKGMGLGLSICRSIVEGHGGRLWASPNPMGGSVFRFSIPLATSMAAATGSIQ